MQFGKNRVQHQEFLWQYIREDDFDIYFNTEGREIADYIAKNASTQLKEIENIFNFNYERRIVFIVYNSYSDYLQSNIGLVSNEEQYNVGGTTNIVGNKIAVYFSGDYYALDNYIREGIAELLFNDLIYGIDNLKEILTNSTINDFPNWYVDGLCTFVANKWRLDIENDLKLYFSKNLNKIKYTDLHTDKSTFLGYGIWKYIALNYGYEAIPSILYLTRISRNIEDGFLYTLGKDLTTLLNDAHAFYKKEFGIQEKFKKHVLSGIEIKKQKLKCFEADKNNQYIAYAKDKGGKRTLFLYDIETQKEKKILKTGNNELLDFKYTYPLIAWHPSSTLFTFIMNYKGVLHMYLYTLETEELIKRPLYEFSDIESIAYSEDGSMLVFSGVQNGQSDIYTYNMLSRNTKKLTNDPFTDIHPAFFNGDKEIIFSSDRTLDTNKYTFQNFDLYKVSVSEKHKSIEPVLLSKYNNELTIEKDSKNNFYFLSDESGSYDIKKATYDSSIVSIDTTIHFDYFFTYKPFVDYPLNMSNYQINSNKNWFSSTTGKSYFISDSLPKFPKTESFFKNERDIWYAYINRYYYDSIVSKRVIKKDSTININNYKFEYEYGNSSISLKEFYQSESDIKYGRIPSMYQKHFYINKIVNQVDFGFLNASYQNYTGGAVYFSPGLNVFIKLGLIDLFENYRLTGGVRISGDLNSNEYLFLAENLEKRIDKQIVYHRQSIFNYGEYSLYKVTNNDLLYRFSYPFSQVSSLSLSTTFRYDKTVSLTTLNLMSLKEPTTHMFRGGLKAEYIFDNTKKLHLNIRKGTRAKIFGEYFKRISTEKSGLFVLGLDARNYITLYKSIILANRFASSYSAGHDKLIYYLGSVDNWINIFSSYERYDHLTQFDRKQNWVYHTLATNMRGYNQNARNGTSFALINSEIRIPVAQSIATRPISSDLVKNIQLVGFADIGSAWTGLFPDYKNERYNYFVISSDDNTTNISSGATKITIKQDLSPLIIGYGFGLRTRLFGYFIRADWAWGYDSGVVKPRIFYLSLSLDF